jgi:hypothetical protein
MTIMKNIRIVDFWTEILIWGLPDMKQDCVSLGCSILKFLVSLSAH